MTTTPEPAPKFVITGKHVLLGMVGFFLIIAVVNAVMIWLAISTFSGEDVRKSYLQGLTYNDTLANREAAAALGWKAASSLVREGETDALLTVDIQDAQSAPVRGLSVKAAIKHPSTTKLDRTLDLIPTEMGSYQVVVPDLATGAWQVYVQARTHDATTDDILFEVSSRTWIDD